MLSLRCLRFQNVGGNVGVMLRREIIPGEAHMAVNGVYIKVESM